MKFFIDGKVVTSKELPLIVILEKEDKDNIANMASHASIYCDYDYETHSAEEINLLLKHAKKRLLERTKL